MPRKRRVDLQKEEELQRNVITMKPQTITGGFPWLALAPFAAAAATPVVSSLGKWVGKKIFGEGVRQSGAGLMRSGDHVPQGAGARHFRAGDLPMPQLVSLPHYRSHTTAGMQGGFGFGDLLNPKTLMNPMGAMTDMLGLGATDKMAKVRAAKGKGKKGKKGGAKKKVKKTKS